jgi:hypothetical protein
MVAAPKPEPKFPKRKRVETGENKTALFKKSGARIVVRYDVGYDNYLYIRGNGPGLSWERGVKLKNVGPDEWVWETDLPTNNCEFKILINDKQYETGDNHKLHNGVAFQYTPRF